MQPKGSRKLGITEIEAEVLPEQNVLTTGS